MIVVILIGRDIVEEIWDSIYVGENKVKILFSNWKCFFRWILLESLVFMKLEYISSVFYGSVFRYVRKLFNGRRVILVYS